MLAYLDESGIPHPNDPSTRPVVISVCISQRDVRSISAQIYALKRQLGTPNIELKGTNLINRRSFERRHNEWELVEAFFDLCRSIPFVVFAVVMERPRRIPHGHQSDGFLPNQYRYLLQRINQYAEEIDEMAVLLFDGDGTTIFGGTVPGKFDSFLHRSQEGRSFTAICDSPYFVDSRLTQGVQIADMVASVCRQYQESNLNIGIPQGDGYLSAINRYYNIVRNKVIDLVSPEGFPRPGIYFMPERDHYHSERARQGQLEGIQNADESTSSASND
ncbi:MAG: DUF3800 domain-containing protein [Chloroflexi bacterium]|nr:DUF3800 domain-containing protein [Chloroflexota bacterium]